MWVHKQKKNLHNYNSLSMGSDAHIFAFSSSRRFGRGEKKSMRQQSAARACPVWWWTFFSSYKIVNSTHRSVAAHVQERTSNIIKWSCVSLRLASSCIYTSVYICTTVWIFIFPCRRAHACSKTALIANIYAYAHTHTHLFQPDGPITIGLILLSTHSQNIIIIFAN